MDNLSWREKIEKFKLPIGLSLVGIVLIIGGVFASGLNKAKPNPPGGGFPKESLVTENQKIISVDVSGAVQKPGVYRLKDGSRIEDAIKSAGGFAQDVNQEYVSKSLNLAQKLSDGSKVYVPREGESRSTSGESGPTSSVNRLAAVNINTASQAELEALPGIASTRAASIIAGRPYQAVEDLLSKKILPKSVFDKIKDQLVTY